MSTIAASAPHATGTVYVSSGGNKSTVGACAEALKPNSIKHSIITNEDAYVFIELVKFTRFMRKNLNEIIRFKKMNKSIDIECPSALVALLFVLTPLNLHTCKRTLQNIYFNMDQLINITLIIN